MIHKFSKKFFVTGTDTEVGKTYVTCQLMQHLSEQNYSVLGLKPVAAGLDSDGFNEDALLLQKNSNVNISYDDINPIKLTTPCSPHIAAKIDGQSVTISKILNKMQTGLNMSVDYTFVEGAGGWYCPINKTETLADLAIELDIPVILIVGIKLGCLNHALLTAESIKKSGLKLQGWVANYIDSDMDFVSENITLLENKLSAPIIAKIKNWNTICLNL